MVVVGLAVCGVGCDKKDETSGSTTGKGAGVTTPTTATATSNTTATATANTATTAATAANTETTPANPMPNITVSAKPPFDSVVFHDTGKKNDKGWPKYDAINASTKPVTFLAIWAYAYDKDGKQLARTRVPLSWNGKIGPGEKSEYAVDVSNSEKAPENAASFELCYDSIKFDGDTKMTEDSKRCPEKRPKGGDSTSSTSSAKALLK
jgi:hypothetical protein